MSDIMSCMPFEQLLNWVRTEHDEKELYSEYRAPTLQIRERHRPSSDGSWRHRSARRQAPTASWRRTSWHLTMQGAVSLN